jgi:hypothetical protein
LDLYIEWWEDYYENNPKELRARFADDNGEMIFTETGDELLDKWEQEIARGLTPDLEEGMPKTEKEKLKEERKLYKRGRKQLDSLCGSKERTKEDRLYDSKRVVPESPEEAALLQKRTLGKNNKMDEWVDLLGGMKNGS